MGDAALYREARISLIDLARARSHELDRPSPGTPEWRVRDVLAHLGGVCDDVVHGNLEGLASDAWTAAQVDKRRAWPAEEVLADWERNGETLDATIDAAPEGLFGQLLFDTWTHEQDIRCALGAPGGRDSALMARSWVRATETMDERDRNAARAALELITEEGTVEVGVAPAATRLEASRFELLRAMTGRRTVEQVRSWPWDGPPDPDRLLLAPFFHWAAVDLGE